MIRTPYKPTLTAISRIFASLQRALPVAAVILAIATTSSAADSTPKTDQHQAQLALESWADAEPTGRLIVKYHAAEDPRLHRRGPLRFKRSVMHEQKQLKLHRRLSEYKELLTTAEPQSIEQLKAKAKSLNDEAYVQYASVEYRRYTFRQPNDPLYRGAQAPGDQAYLYEGQYSMNAPGAWDISVGSSSSVIAIVDTGILAEHPEIKDRSIPELGYDFVSADSPQVFTSANDGDGRDSDPTDPGDPCRGSASSWHGTEVASAAAANSNNGEGFSGIDWNAQLLHARALGTCGGNDADIIDAIRWSVGLPVEGAPNNPNPANVVNLSLGGPTECTTAWQDVIDELATLNVVFVMAAGNENTNALRSAPANCANVITVGSSTPGGLVDVGFSNYGLKVTIATAGRNIVVASNQGSASADPDGYYHTTETGTSLSAALVSGAISLMHSIDPDLGPSEVRALLHETATDFASGNNCDTYYCGGGILNLARAMTQLRDGNFDRNKDLAMEQITNQSAPIELQQTINATLFGYKDIRYFTMNIPQRGLLEIESSGTEDTYAYILDSELSVIALDDDSGNARNFRVSALVDPGTYFIAVERARHQLSDGESPFSFVSTLNNDSPDQFEFEARNVVANAQVESNTVVISGLSGSSIVAVSNGFYTLNGDGPFDTPLTVVNGDRISVIAQAAGTVNATTTVALRVGTYTTDFSVTTGNSTFTNGGDANKSSSGCSIQSSQNKGALDPLFFLLLSCASAGLARRRTKI